MCLLPLLDKTDSVNSIKKKLQYCFEETHSAIFIKFIHKSLIMKLSQVVLHKKGSFATLSYLLSTYQIFVATEKLSTTALSFIYFYLICANMAVKLDCCGFFFSYKSALYY